ncbi:hypothetical protein VFPBJ_01955 [Purpureocillium lilacinum]|uniref:Uncharacterized protein n=1 Tax=Purpureocillium lilacinum TaxID=33203 RepID=A0A179HCX9_PURLI|nr:hypothetical protein VFPBJ_01955 [Purpureocillium lilacinum]
MLTQTHCHRPFASRHRSVPGALAPRRLSNEAGLVRGATIVKDVGEEGRHYHIYT